MNNIYTPVRVHIKSGHRECTFQEWLYKTALIRQTVNRNFLIHKAFFFSHSDATLIVENVPLGQSGAKYHAQGYHGGRAGPWPNFPVTKSSIFRSKKSHYNLGYHKPKFCCACHKPTTSIRLINTTSSIDPRRPIQYPGLTWHVI